MRLLSRTDVAEALARLPSSEIIAAIGRALYTYSHTSDSKKSDSVSSSSSIKTPDIQNPLRINVLTPAHNVLFMPSRLGSASTTSIKVVSVPRSEGDKRGLPATTLLIDEETGEARAVINARELTAVRTAAASALAISLSRTASKARQLLIFGSGLQALWHAKLVASLSSELKEILVATRAISERSECVLGDLRKHFHGHNIQVRGISIDDAVAPQGPVERADIVCCCTPTTEVLFAGSRLKSGASLSLIGSYKPHMREVDLVSLLDGKNGTPRAQRIIVDSESACRAEAGELYDVQRELPHLMNEGSSSCCLVELGTLLDPRGNVKAAAMARSSDEVTVFKCVGLGVMDSAVSAVILHEAEKQGLGQTVDFL